MSDFPRATRILLKALADPEIKHLVDTLASSWSEAQDKAVADERERCAGIAEQFERDEMDYAARICAANIATEIRKARCSATPQADTSSDTRIWRDCITCGNPMKAGTCTVCGAPE